MSDFSIACAFVVPPSADHDCHQQGLFRAEYQRANRMHGVKILRCFPHCCPDHKPRSYCGRPLFLRVAGVGGRTPCDVAQLQAFGRFREEQSEPLHVGDQLRAADVESSLQSDQNPTGEWVASMLVSSSARQGLFEINASARWVYTWSSGASKEQRRTPHVLEVAVVRPIGNSFEVLTTTTSPPFTIVSFRRAADAAAHKSLLYQALTWDHQHGDTLHGLARLPASPAQLHDDQRVPPPPPSRAQPTNSRREDVASPPPATALFVHAMSRIFAWVMQLPATELTPSAIEWIAHQNATARVSSAQPQQLATQLIWRMQIVADAALDACGVDYQLADVVLDLPAMSDTYEQYTIELQRQCEDLMRGSVWTWRTLATALTETIAPSTASPSLHPFSWTNFVARICQRVVQQQRPSRRLSISGFSTSTRWSCRADAVRVSLSRRPGPSKTLVETLSVGGFFVFWTQLSSLSVEWTVSHLYITSTAPSVYRDEPSRPGLVLILDGHDRFFTTFPHGEPTMGMALPGAYTTGDYIGSIHEDGAKVQVHVTTFVWPSDRRRERPEAYRWRWTWTSSRDPEIKQEHSLNVALHIDVGIVSSDAPLETMPLRQKLDLVDDWSEMYHALLPYTLG